MIRPELTASAVLTMLTAVITPTFAAPGDVIPGERLDASAYGPSYVESMQAAIDRDRLAPLPEDTKSRGGRNGYWTVPTRGSSATGQAGDHYIINKWGDTRIGISFPRLADVAGANFIGQSSEGVWTPGVRVIGYANREIVGETEWFTEIGDAPQWFEMDLRGVDRIEIIAVPSVGGGGWYGLDDLMYTEPETGRSVVVDFDDLDYRAKLTGSNYAGLFWEEGTGDFISTEGVPAPEMAIGGEIENLDGVTRDVPIASGTRASGPVLLDSFQGVLRGDAGSSSYPPDTHGAIGPDHFVITVNRNFAIYDKYTGAELTNILLSSFLPGSNGDPRVLYDQHSGRWIVLVTDFSATESMFLAVSRTSDPTGNWFKTSFESDQGEDAGRWPDYPTLGVDQYGIYIAAYMVPTGMSCWALDKAPLIGPSPSLGTITAWRGFPMEGALQPAHTYGTPGSEYLISQAVGGDLQLRRIDPPMTAPTLVDLGQVQVPSYSAPPDAPALGSGTNLDTVGSRLMMAVYRDGSLWTCQTIGVSGRAACRWYEIDPAAGSVLQHGTVADDTLHFFFPSIMVNDAGHAMMGFTGSSASQYAGCYFTGRLVTDPPGEMAVPEQYRAGGGAQNNIDGYGRNRWGDYSYTTLDPDDEHTFWTIQEYGHSNNIWGTYVASALIPEPDCNNNGIPDHCDVDCGPSGEYCDVAGCGGSPDCNSNSVPDECDIASGTSTDLNGNGLPDECEDCNNNGVPDSEDISGGTSQDCNNNGLPDECDLASGTSQDATDNGIPDECEGTPCGANEVAKSVPSEGAGGDLFGVDVAMSGEVAVVGAYGDDDRGSNAGAAYVYRRVGAEWQREAKLLAADGASTDLAGRSVDVDGDTAIISSHQDDDSGSDSGSAYVFFFDGNDWVQQAKLLPTDGAGGDYFGYSVAIDGDLALVGAYRDDDNGADSGAAYVFERTGSTWSQAGKLVPGDNAAGDGFGYAVALDGNVALISSYRDNDTGINAGSAYVYRYDGANWSEEDKLLSSDGNAYDQFGVDVAVAGDLAVVGADQFDFGGTDDGQAYVFEHVGGDWIERARLRQYASPSNANFGTAVAIDATNVVIGASGAMPGASGAAFLFTNDGERWLYSAEFTPSDGITSGFFGASAAISGEHVLVSAPQDDDNGSFSGSLYSFAGVADCNENGVLDICDITVGMSLDVNGNGTPDECESFESLGDCNCDGTADIFDIDAFVQAITNPAEYATTYPACDIANADCNQDGTPDIFDIDAFVALITGG